MSTYPATRTRRPRRKMFDAGVGRARGPMTREHDKLLFDTTRWQAFLYNARHKATAEAERDLDEPLRIDATLKDAPAKQVKQFAEAMGRELFGRMYADPARLEETKAPSWMEKVHATLDEMPEWEQLKAQVASDPDLSALATNAMLRALKPKLGDMIAEAQEEEQEGGPGGPKGGRGGIPGVTAADAMRAALRGACKTAAKDAQDGRDALGGLAPGLDGTPPTDEQRETDRFDLLQAALKNPDLQRILRRAGRLRRISGRADRRRTKDAYEEIVDIELGGELERLCANELIMLRHPRLRQLQRAKLADRRAMQYRLEGHEPQGRGPMIFLRDVSGSMGGDPHQWGAAIAIALSSQATREKRNLWSACFNGNVHAGRRLSPEGLHKVGRKGVVGDRIADGRTAPGIAALHHVKDGCCGGTYLTPAVVWAFKVGVLEPRADFVILTDDAFYLDDQTVQRLVEARERGLRVWGLAINGGSFSDNLEAICDEVIDVDKLDGEDAVAKRIGGMLHGARR